MVVPSFLFRQNAGPPIELAVAWSRQRAGCSRAVRGCGETQASPLLPRLPLTNEVLD